MREKVCDNYFVFMLSSFPHVSGDVISFKRSSLQICMLCNRHNTTNFYRKVFVDVIVRFKGEDLDEPRMDSVEES